MAVKLNQIVAVVSGKKTRVEKEFGDLNKIVQKPELFNGLTRNYHPLAEDGEAIPPENKLPQQSVKDMIVQVKSILSGVMDAVATQEYGNQSAKANIKVNGVVLAADVPVTVLLYLEKQTHDLHTFVSNLPVLDASFRWTYNEQDGKWRADEVRTVRTKKLQKPIVLHPPTVEHPAQTQMITEDVTVGHWTSVMISQMMSSVEKQRILDKLVVLSDAIKVAREEANSIEVQQINIAGNILNYIFG